MVGVPAAEEGWELAEGWCIESGVCCCEIKPVLGLRSLDYDSEL